MTQYLFCDLISNVSVSQPMIFRNGVFLPCDIHVLTLKVVVKVIKQATV